MNGSSPDVVATAIHHALTARTPRTRYRVGKHSTLLAAPAAFLPDRLLDAVRFSHHWDADGIQLLRYECSRRTDRTRSVEGAEVSLMQKKNARSRVLAPGRFNSVLGLF
jgi:hypothetical protein